MFAMLHLKGVPFYIRKDTIDQIWVAQKGKGCCMVDNSGNKIEADETTEEAHNIIVETEIEIEVIANDQ